MKFPQRTARGAAKAWLGDTQRHLWLSGALGLSRQSRVVIRRDACRGRRVGDVVQCRGGVSKCAAARFFQHVVVVTLTVSRRDLLPESPCILVRPGLVEFDRVGREVLGRHIRLPYQDRTPGLVARVAHENARYGDGVELPVAQLPGDEPVADAARDDEQVGRDLMVGQFEVAARPTLALSMKYREVDANESCHHIHGGPVYLRAP